VADASLPDLADTREPVNDAQAIVGKRFPDAVVALLGSAVLGARRTPTSDLDLVIVRAEQTSPRWEGFHHGRWPVEVFVSDRRGWNACIDAEVRARRPVVLDVSATGVALSSNEETKALQREARELLANGPLAATQAELELAGRLLGDPVEDLSGGLQGCEQTFVIEAIARQAAELFLLGRRRWLGVGKWLGRALSDGDASLAEGLDVAVRSACDGNVEPLLAVVAAVVDSTGGPPLPDWTAEANTSKR